MSKKDPYDTCKVCVVKNWCGRRSGTHQLPDDYHISSECNGYILLERAIQLSNIPKEYRHANKRNFKIDDDNKEYADNIMYFLDKPVEIIEKGLNMALFHNNKGTGKTFTACAIANEFIFKTCIDSDWFDYENPLALYIKYGDWANAVRKAHQTNNSDDFEKMYAIIDDMKEVPLLILDDIGSGRITPVIRDLTYDVIDYRKEHMKTIIYTSNLVDSALRKEDYLGDVIVSRMMYRTVFIGLGGRDRRVGGNYVK